MSGCYLGEVLLGIRRVKVRRTVSYTARPPPERCARPFYGLVPLPVGKLRGPRPPGWSQWY